MLTEFASKSLGKEPDLNNCVFMQILFQDVTKYLNVGGRLNSIR